MKTRFGTLRELIESLGVPQEEIERAEADGTLGLLAMEHMALGDQTPRYTQGEVEERSGLGPEAARFWRALGFTDPPPDERVFGDLDIEMLQLVDQFLQMKLVHTDVALLGGAKVIPLDVGVKGPADKPDYGLRIGNTLGDPAKNAIKGLLNQP